MCQIVLRPISIDYWDSSEYLDQYRVPLLRGQSYPFWVPYDYHSIRIHIFGTNNIGCKALIFEQDPQWGKKVNVSPIYSVRKIGREEGLMHATNNPVGVMRSGLRIPVSLQDKQNGFPIEGTLRFGTFSKKCIKAHGKYFVDIFYEEDMLVTDLGIGSQIIQNIFSVLPPGINAIEYNEYNETVNGKERRSVVFRDDAKIKIRSTKNNFCTYLKNASFWDKHLLFCALIGFLPKKMWPKEELWDALRKDHFLRRSNRR